jgi:hypothetical protein
MDVKPYVEIIRKTGSQARKLFCAYCGAQTPAGSAEGLCSGCESPVYYTLDEVRATSPAIIDVLGRINDAIAKNGYDAASADYEKLMAGNKDDANLFYVAGLFYIKYSNYEVSRINYKLPGFMEQNSAQRHRANDLTSKARLLLNRAVYISDAAVAMGNDALRQTYIRFLCSIKLQKLREAKGSLEKIKGMGDRTLASYAELVLRTNAGEYDYVIGHAKELISAQDFVPNAAFYLSAALFKKRMYGESEAVVKALDDQLATSNVRELLGEIARAKASF